MVEVEKRLREMGLELPEVPMEMETRVRCRRVGNIIFMGMTGPWPITNKAVEGKKYGTVGRELTYEEGKFACKMCALSVVAALKNELGDLDRVDKIVNLNVHINGVGGKDELYSNVADGASELFVELFGENGKAARSIVSNFMDCAVELSVVVSVKD